MSPLNIGPRNGRETQFCQGYKGVTIDDVRQFMMIDNSHDKSIYRI